LTKIWVGFTWVVPSAKIHKWDLTRLVLFLIPSFWNPNIYSLSPCLRYIAACIYRWLVIPWTIILEMKLKLVKIK